MWDKNASLRGDSREALILRTKERHELLQEGEYRELLEKQNGNCAICKKPEKRRDKFGRLKSLAVDHCHTDGHVRGLLCADCNVALGYFGDSPDILESAIRYLLTGPD